MNRNRRVVEERLNLANLIDLQDALDGNQMVRLLRWQKREDARQALAEGQAAEDEQGAPASGQTRGAGEA